MLTGKHRQLSVLALLASLIFHAASASPAPANSSDTPQSVVLRTEASLLVEQAWRIDRAIAGWLQRCQSLALGGSVSPDDLVRDAGRLAKALSALGSESPGGRRADEAAVRRKLLIQRTLSSPLEDFVASAGATGCPSAQSAPSSPAARPRVVRVSDDCEDAIAISEETVAWQFPLPPGGSLTTEVSGETWLRLDAARGGRFSAHTQGSTADTEIAVFDTCTPGASPLAVDDDTLGLQSAVAFEALAGQSRWIRVRQRIGRVVDPVLLTVLGGETGISGVVTESASGDPISDTRVEIREKVTGSYAGSDWTDSSGAYSVVGLTPGIYVALTDFSDNHVDELWDDHPCADGCDPTTGDPIGVVNGTVTSGIDFALLRASAISGRLRDAETGEALSNYRVRVTEADGSSGGSEDTDGAGRYAVGGLSPGIHFVNTQDSLGYRDEVYDDIPCVPFCDPLDGTPIVVAAEETVPDIDFELDRLGLISGTVTDASSGLAISFARVEAYDATGSQVASDSTDLLGQYLIGGLDTGMHFVATDEFGGHRNEVYDDIPCTGLGSGNCEPLTGSPVAVVEGETTIGIDFALDRLGVFAGQLIDSSSGVGLPFSQVRAWTESGDFVNATSTNSIGIYVVEDLTVGSYRATTAVDDGHLDELYDDLPCLGEGFPACDVTLGSPIPVALGEVTAGIDFALVLGGSITGTLHDAFTGEPIAIWNIEIWDASGIRVRLVGPDSAGVYHADALPTGTYFASTRTFGAFADELYDDLPCPGGAPTGCDPLTGSPISVTVGETTADVDMDLDLLGGLSGFVTAAGSGAPLPGVAIDVWDQNGAHLAATATNVEGAYQVDLQSGIFLVSTDAGQSYMDEIYDDVACPDGPAILGLCDPLAGHPLTVTGAATALRGIDIGLIGLIFTDGFESGDTSAWSSTVP